MAGMITVKIRTNDRAWATKNGINTEDEPTTGAILVTIKVQPIEYTRFAGNRMVRFDLGPKCPRDWNRNALVPVSYIVNGDAR